MYENFYSLSGKPFQLSPDARFFFNSSGHNRAMAYLRYGLRQGEGFIVITGGIGTGKTMLVSNLFNELHDDNVVAAQLVSTQINEDDVLRMISAAFGLAHENLSKAALLRNLEAFFRARRAEGRRVLLVVDEAQNLPQRAIEELRMLSNYQEDGQALLQSFLLGQLELKQTLQGPGMEQVRQRIIAGYHLRPLDRQELQAYVEHRLALVGWQNDPAISDAAFDAIFTSTGGVPRRVNTLCDRLMLFGSLEELHEFTDTHVLTVVEEMTQEIGRGDGASGESSGSGSAAAHARASADRPGDLEGRVALLEQEVQQLRSALARTRRLVKQAIMLQMDADDEDDAL
ncbi:MAG: XrtA-associated ATPase [Gammaproteobacteria bacterium]|nr:XrtA-associated ATPase [Gammaproteobacteria bacterium]